MLGNQNQQFKEYPNQNFIELKFKDNHVNELNQNQALLKYKLNSYIVGRIFSFNEKDESEVNDEQLNIEYLSIEDILGDVQQEIFKLKEQNNLNQQAFIDQNREFHNYMSRVQHVKTKKELSSLVEELYKKEMILSDFPFFNEKSPFYNYRGDSQMLSVDHSMIEGPLFKEDEFPNVLQL